MQPKRRYGNRRRPNKRTAYPSAAASLTSTESMDPSPAFRPSFAEAVLSFRVVPSQETWIEPSLYGAIQP